MNVLVVDRDPIYPPTNGKEVRVARVVEWLADHHDVWLACQWPDTDDAPPSVHPIPLKTRLLDRKITMTQGWFLSYLFGAHPRYDRLFSRRITADTALDVDVDIVLSESPQTTTAARRLAEQNDAFLLLDKHNAYHTILNHYLESRGLPKPIRRRPVRNLRAFEQQAIKEADAIVFQSEDDHDLFEVPAGITSRVVPNGCDYQNIAGASKHADPQGELEIEPDRPLCVFVGSFDYEMNRLAAERIAEEIAPEMTDVQFLLLGRDPPPIEAKNVIAPGFVKDLAGTLKLSDVGICPLEFGSGTKLKILDYCAAGLPIVTSSVGAQGLRIRDGKNALIRDSTSEICNAIRKLLQSPELGEQLGEEAEELAKEYAWKKLLKKYDEIIPPG